MQVMSGHWLNGATLEVKLVTADNRAGRHHQHCIANTNSRPGHSHVCMHGVGWCSQGLPITRC